MKIKDQDQKFKTTSGAIRNVDKKGEYQKIYQGTMPPNALTEAINANNGFKSLTNRYRQRQSNSILAPPMKINPYKRSQSPQALQFLSSFNACAGKGSTSLQASPSKLKNKKKFIMTTNERIGLIHVQKL